MKYKLSIYTVLAAFFTLYIGNNQSKAQTFNHYHLIINDYKISDSSFEVSVEPEFKIADEYLERGEKVTVFEFGYSFQNTLHSKQIMVVEMNEPLTNFMELRNFLNKIETDLDLDGYHVQHIFQDNDQVLKFDKTLQEDPKVYIRGRVKLHRHRLYFVISEIKGNVESKLATRWQNNFFDAVLINRKSVNPFNLYRYNRRHKNNY